MSYTHSSGYGRVIETYPPINVHAERVGRCPVCRKRVRRNCTFTATESPFNRAVDGHVRTRPEIQAKLREDAKAWVPDFTHYTCMPDN